MSGQVRLRYWAAARAAAGVAEEALPAGPLADVLAAAEAAHGPRLAAVLAVCSFVVDGEPVGGRDRAALQVAPGALVDVLPPFAGG